MVALGGFGARGAQDDKSEAGIKVRVKGEDDRAPGAGPPTHLRPQAAPPILSRSLRSGAGEVRIPALSLQRTEGQGRGTLVDDPGGWPIQSLQQRFDGWWQIED